MIITINQTNILQAAEIHSVSWQESHRSFCSPVFVNLHTPEHQKEYLANKMNKGSNIYMLVEDKPIGIVSVTGSLIEDLYVLPEKQGMGYGTELLQFAIRKCTGVPTLWILENNKKAEKLYRRIGFKETGRSSAITAKLREIEFSLQHPGR